VVGRRQIVTHTTTAQPRYTTQDLTPADFLNPQPGDEFFHGDSHAALVAYLARCFRHLYRYSPIVAVLVGAKLIWDDPTLAQPAPDITVVANLTDPQRLRDRLDIAAEGARPRFILEVTSPALASLDLAEKVELYARAGVQEYFIVQPAPDAQSTAATIIAYRLDQGVYQPLAPDTAGRVYSATNKVWFTADTPQTGASPDSHGAHGLRLVEERSGRTLIPPDDHDDEPSAAAQVDATLRAQSIASKLNLGR
jgi:Uma2 family endonuclease